MGISSSVLNSVLYRSILESYKLFRKKKSIVLIECIADLAFFVVFGFIYSFLALRMLDYLYEISNVINSRIAEIQVNGEVYQQMIDTIAQQQTLDTNITAAIRLGVIILLVFYVMWSFFQGYNWKLTNRIVHKDVDFLKFLKRFSVINIIFFLVFGVILSIFLQLALYNLQSIISVITKPFLNLAIIFLGIAFFYFLSLSYAIAGRHNLKESVLGSFRLGLGKASVLAPGFLLVVLKFYVIFNMIGLLALYSQPISLVAGVLLILPFFAWTRIFLLVVVEKVEKK